MKGGILLFMAAIIAVVVIMAMVFSIQRCTESGGRLMRPVPGTLECVK